MDLRTEIIQEYHDLVEQTGEKITRDSFRKLATHTTALIDKLWGSWGNFMKEISGSVSVGRGEKKIIKRVNSDKVLITSVVDGSHINLDCLNALKNYAKINNAELVILWSKAQRIGQYFAMGDYAQIQDYLCTEVQFEKDETCLAKDVFIPVNNVQPLNLAEEVFPVNLRHIILAHPKQYLKMLAYKAHSNRRDAWSTGTISDIIYKEDIKGIANTNYHCLGGLIAEFDKDLGYYLIRNLVFDGKYIFDLNQRYGVKGTPKPVTAAAMALGDLHFPEEDPFAVTKSIQQINLCKPEYTFLHDICSFNSINPHEANRAVDKVKSITNDNITLEMELNVTFTKLDGLITECPDTTFCVVSSNHDQFVRKWLNDGNWVKDQLNANIGCKMFLSLTQGKNVFEGYSKFPDRLKLLGPKDSMVIKGYEMACHGHEGIAGAKGSTKTYTKVTDNSVTGHTHSPQIFKSTFVVGTNSKYELPYTGDLMNWGHSNVIVHQNGTCQQIFCD